MKRKTVLLTLILSMLCLACGFVGCQKDGGMVEMNVVASTETQVVLYVETLDGQATLKACMDALQKDGKISYEISSGMVNDINGKAAEGTYYWALYTTDTSISDAQTKITAANVECYYAMAGAETLNVKAGCYYVWNYESWA